MRKMILSVMTLMVFLICSEFVFAAAMRTTYGGVDARSWTNGQNIHRIKVRCVQVDGDDPAAFSLSDVTGIGLSEIELFRGGIFFQFETVPLVTPDAVYTLAVSSDKGSSIASLTGLSVSAGALHNGAVDLGFTPIIWDLSIDFGDLGSAEDAVDLYLYIIK